MTVRCAWCGSMLGTDARPGGESHGICPSCERNKFPDVAAGGRAHPRPRLRAEGERDGSDRGTER